MQPSVPLPCTRVCCTHCHTQTPSATHRHPLQNTAAAPRMLYCLHGSLSPMKYICGSAGADKLLNCVCGRFMEHKDTGGRGGSTARHRRSRQGHHTSKGGSGAHAGAMLGATCEPSVNNPATDLQVTGRLPPAPSVLTQLLGNAPARCSCQHGQGCWCCRCCKNPIPGAAREPGQCLHRSANPPCGLEGSVLHPACPWHLSLLLGAGRH